MSAAELRDLRRHVNLSQVEAAARLGVSQPYLSLLERGARPLTPALMKKLVRAYALNPSRLPLSSSGRKQPTNESVVQQLASLGYPGFLHRSARKVANPAEVLLNGLLLPCPEARVTEALPWVLLQYPELDGDWLTGEVKRHDLQNRAGFVLGLALEKLQEGGETHTPRYRALHDLHNRLTESRLLRESSLAAHSLSEREYMWTKQHRSALARFWNVVSDFRSEHLRYGI